MLFNPYKINKFQKIIIFSLKFKMMLKCAFKKIWNKSKKTNFVNFFIKKYHNSFIPITIYNCK